MTGDDTGHSARCDTNIQHTDNTMAQQPCITVSSLMDGMAAVQRSGRRCGVLRLTRGGTNVSANSMRSASLQIAGGGGKTIHHRECERRSKTGLLGARHEIADKYLLHTTCKRKTHADLLGLQKNNIIIIINKK